MNKDKKYTFIFIGNSGCGKGTQAELIKKEFENNNNEVLYIEAGNQFRQFLSKTTYTAKKAREIAKVGGLQPKFLAVSLWAEIFNSYYSPEKDLIIDGTPRTLGEAIMLESAFRFYDLKNPIVIYINISTELAKERMLSRGRLDDDIEKIENRLKWFEDEVVPVINFFKENSYYNYAEIDGSKTIEEINKEIINKFLN